MLLDNKVAIVTGGDSGIGHAIALELASEGASVTVNYHRDAEAAAATLRAIEQAGGRGRVQQADVSSVPDIGALVDETVKAFGRLDVMVNNAGMETRTSVLDTTEDQFDRVIGVDLKSAFFGTQAAARQMIAQGGGGRIINISSIHEDWPMPGNAPYCAAKGGVRMLTRTAGVELAPHGSPWWAWRRARCTRPSTGPLADPGGAPGSSPRSRWAASPSPRRSRAWSRSWPPTRPRTAPRQATRSTAA